MKNIRIGQRELIHFVGIGGIGERPSPSDENHGIQNSG